MNRQQLCLSLIFLCAIPVLYGQDILWERSYGGRHADFLCDVLPTADYGFILAGSSLSGKSGTKNKSGRGDIDYCLWKMDEHGQQDWQNSFGGSGSDMLTSIGHTTDGGFILGGTSNSPIGADKTEACRGGNDYWVVRLDAKGNAMWQKTLGGSAQDDLLAVCQARDGGYIIGGSSASGKSGDKASGSRGNMDYWIIKLDHNGNEQWQKSYGGKYADVLRAIVPTTDGGYIVGGYSNSPQSGDKTVDNHGKGGDYWILKLNDTGDIQWQQCLGGEGDDQLYALVQTYDGGYLAGGNSVCGATGNKNTVNKNGTDLWVLKLDDKGFAQWQQSYDFGSVDILTSVVENPDHSFLIGGYAQGSLTGKDKEGINDYIALKISEKGDVLWDKTVGSDGEDMLRKAIQARDGGYIMAGTSNPEQQHFRKAPADKKPSVSIGNGTQAALANDARQAIEETANTMANQINNTADKKIGAATGKINQGISKATGQQQDSRIKFGMNAPTGKLMNLSQQGGKDLLDSAGEMLANKGPKQGLHASRDKKTNYGGRDFWVVKLGDKDKKQKDRKTLEAIPNPVQEYTNVIIGFEFDKGTISVFDMAGRPLQSFAITQRTVPVNMGAYPEGIYIIKVSTNKGEGSVKVIKGINKN